MTTALDLTRLPLPAAVEALDAEAIIAAMKADLVTLDPDLAAVVDLESEPAVKLIQTWAYRELLTRGRMNDVVRSQYLATATGADLDNVVAIYGVSRLLITPANPLAIPPVAAVYEDDAALRRRALLSIEAFSVAGPRGAWAYHALTADPDVLDVGVYGPDDVGAGVALGSVRIAVLSRTGDGTASPALLAAVEAALSDETVRPLGVLPVVEAAVILPYAVEATVAFLPGPGSGAALDAIIADVEQLVSDAHRVGAPLRRSALFAALHRLGVVAEVTLTSPAADIEPAPGEAPWCSAITITEAV
jgi:phage-related baseplate assembly protein